MPPPDRLTILFLAANPAGAEPLRLDEEMRAIDQELRKPAYGERFDLRSAWAVRYSDLQDHLLRYRPHIVHFSGHGSPTGEIMLVDVGGNAHPVAPDDLAALFAILKDNVRCVVLNACYSERQARGIARSIDCVVGMAEAVTDAAAIDFAAGFYLGLGYGRSVQTAFELGRNRISLAGLGDEQRTPKLVVRRGVNIRELVLLAAPPAPSQPLSEPPAATVKIPVPPAPLRPPETPGFVGRNGELAWYTEQLQATGLAAICGMVGTGKSALASVLARRVAAPERIFWCSFHAEEGIRTLIWRLAAFLAHHGRDDLWQMLQSTRQTGGQLPPDEMLFDYAFQLLQGQGFLLCLDDLQFVDEDPLFVEQTQHLLELLAARKLALIITSRHIPDFVPSSQVAPLSGLSEADTRALLAARGLALPSSLIAALYAQTAGNAQLLTLAVDAIQHGRDPARLIAHLPATDYVERYLLRQVDRGLTESERAVMQVVALLLGQHGTRAAIEAIMAVGSVRGILQDLSSRFLLVVSDVAQERTYGLHTTLQAFYYDLMSQRERSALHLRAADYYGRVELDLLTAARHYQCAGETTRAAALATQDVWSLINQGQGRALQQLLDDFAPELLDPLALARVNLARGQISALLGDGEAARTSFERALQLTATAPVSTELRQLRVHVYEALGRLLEGEAPQAAMAWLQRGYAEIGDAGGQAEAALHIRMGSVHIAVGDYDAALTALTRGLALLPDQPGQLRASALLNLGNVYFSQGHPDQGAVFTLQALAISRELHDHFWVLAIKNNLAIDKETRGDWYGASADYQEALTLAAQLGSVADLIRLENSLGTLFTKWGDDEEAGAHLARALELARKHKYHEGLAYVLASLADLKLRMGELAAVAPLLDETEQLAVELNIGALVAEACCLRGEWELGQGNLSFALIAAQGAVARAGELGLMLEEGRYLRVLACTQAAMQQEQQAAQTFAQSLLAIAEQDPYEAARTKLAWGRLLLAGGSQEDAEPLLTAALSTFHELGARRELDWFAAHISPLQK